MRLVDITGRETRVDGIQELQSLLQRRDANGANAFWLSHEARFPVLVVLVQGERAAVQYMPRERDAGCVSVGTPNDGVTRFAISKHPADDVLIMNETLLPLSAALEAAKEFFHSETLPQSVQWLKL